MTVPARLLIPVAVGSNLADVAATTALDDNDANVRAYDFARPNRLTRERTRALRTAGEDAGRRASVTLGRLFGIDAEVTLGTTEEAPYQDFLHTLPASADLCVVSTGENAAGLGVVVVPETIAQGLIQRLLGGPLVEIELGRPPTESESALVEMFLSPLLEALAESLRFLASLALKPVRHELDTAALQIADDRDSLIVIGFQVRVGELAGPISIGLSHRAFVPILEAIDRRSALSSRARSRKRAERLDEILGLVPVELAVGYPPISLRSCEVLQLSVGDVVRLGQPVDAELLAWVGGLPRMTVSCASAGRQLVFEVRSMSAPLADRPTPKDPRPRSAPSISPRAETREKTAPENTAPESTAPENTAPHNRGGTNR